ncbi:TonB-dependent receptor plug domain-containing protein [bacterium]|nr:MAG: TonB-dependent receptor plug domain-containing protein [bacterium]
MWSSDGKNPNKRFLDAEGFYEIKSSEMHSKIAETILCVFFLLGIPYGVLEAQEAGSIKIPPDSAVVSGEDSLWADAFSKLTIQHINQQADSANLFFHSDSSFFYKIISHDEMMKSYHGDFADWLWVAGGFYVHDLGSYGKPITASTNGLSNRHILVLLDGIPMNDPDAGWINLNTISLENIERIEIFRGNGSPRYGDQAAGGYVNIVPRQFTANEPLTSIKFRSAFSPFQDIGIFFGRNLGSHLQVYVGGSAKETPGEQNVQGLQGGFLYNFQRTRYAGKNLYAGINFLITPDWSMKFYTQSNKDRFDAYGRNIFGDKNIFDFSTVGGFRKDERTDYHMSLTGKTDRSLFQSHLYFVNINRNSNSFPKEISIPSFYSTQSVGWDGRYGLNIAQHRLWIGGEYVKRSIDRIPTQETRSNQTAIFAGDTFEWNTLVIQPSGRYEYHTIYHQAFSGALTVTLPVNDHLDILANAGHTETFPTLMDEFQNNVGRYETQFSGFPPGDFNFPINFAKNLSKQTTQSLSSSIHVKNIFYFDRVVISGYGNNLRDALYYYPVNFNTDSMEIKVGNLSRSKTYGVEFEFMKKIAMFEFTARQSLSKGDDEVRQGVPAYRTYFSGYGTFLFLKNNLKLTGFLSAMYVGKHAGFSFHDAPQIYFITPRYARGGWILNTRISVNIGTLQIFYEAENFPRVRFTMLDGYDITRQQVRVGLIWKLYN